MDPALRPDHVIRSGLAYIVVGRKAILYRPLFGVRQAKIHLGPKGGPMDELTGRLNPFIGAL